MNDSWDLDKIAGCFEEAGIHFFSVGMSHSGTWRILFDIRVFCRIDSWRALGSYSWQALEYSAINLLLLPHYLRGWFINISNCFDNVMLLNVMAK